MNCPISLGAHDAQIVSNHHLECGKYKIVDHIICNRKLYDCGGVLVYLPSYSSSELNLLYSHYYSQAKLSYDSDRPIQQSNFVTTHVPNVPNMTIYEIGCAAAHLLSRLRKVYNPTRIVCNEKAKYKHRDSHIMFDEGMSLTNLEKDSIDLFLSSLVYSKTFSGSFPN